MNSSGFEYFCGGPLWNSSLTWQTANPTFTNCFLWTAVAWLPCLCFVSVSPAYVSCYLLRLPVDRSVARKTSLAYRLKIMTSSTLVLTGGSCALYCCALHVREALPPVAVVTSLFFTLTFVISLLVIKIEQDKKLVTSGFHSFFYLLLFISSIIYGYSIAWQSMHEWDPTIVSRFRVSAYIIFYGIFSTQILVMLILFCFSDRVAVLILQRKNPDVCPESVTSFFGRLVFAWTLSLIIKGYKKSLNIFDLWRPFDGQNATRNGEEFLKLRRQNKSLVGILMRMFGAKLVVSHAAMLFVVAGLFLVPFLLSIFIEFFDDPSVEHWKGILCSCCFLINYFLESMAWQQMMYVGFDVGARVKATLTAAAFHKLLHLDTTSAPSSGNQNQNANANCSGDANKARKDKRSNFPTTSGEVVNLISMDVHNIGEATSQLHLLWTIPVQTALVLAILWVLLGSSMVALMVIVCFTLFALSLTSRCLKSPQSSQLKQKDGRIKLFAEIINGIKLLKLYTWEEAFEARLLQLREKELSSLKKFYYINSINIFSSLFVSNLTTFVTFSIYSWISGPLTARKAFTSMSVFNLMQHQLLLMPVISSHFIKARVSLKRVDDFLNLQELRPYVQNIASDVRTGSTTAVEITGGVFSWDASTDPVLKNINLHVPSKSLTAIVGLVGSGKSSLLSAILGEMRKLEGSVKVEGSVGYVSQQTWIQNATMRDNILFGLPYQHDKYVRIVEACALARDLKILPDGDLTVIGERGINLSGGQKQRVSLARSLYQDCQVYLLDDPLSAVDSHVAKHIFARVIGPEGLLKDKTRLLVTHSVTFLPHVDQVAALEDGTIKECGGYDDLSKSGGRMSRFVENSSAVDVPGESNNCCGEQMLNVTGGIERTSTGSRTSLKKSRSNVDLADECRGRSEDDGACPLNPEAVGSVKFSAYKFTALQLGYIALLFMLLFFLIFKSFSVMSIVWISYWTGDKALYDSFEGRGAGNLSSPNVTGASDYYGMQKFYISSYALFVIAHAFFLVCYCITSVESFMRASEKCHASMLHRILRAPMAFFESTPTGRILNRFSRDLDVLDTNLPDFVHQWLVVFTSLLSTVVIVSMSIPPFVGVAILLVVVFLIIQHFYLPTVRQLKWEESNSRSPIYGLVCETMSGLGTIRTFKKQNAFRKKFERLVDDNTVFNFASNAAERWLGFQLEFLGAVTTFAASMFSVFHRSSLTGAVVGMFMASSIQDSFSLCYLIRLNSAMETSMVSMERLKEYLAVDVEETDLDGVAHSLNPPLLVDARGRYEVIALSNLRRGKIEFSDYSMKYRPDLDCCLKGISIIINPGEKVGIVGRTGAGKSSLISALFRFSRIHSGHLYIDDVDVTSIPLKLLRMSVTVLPQDPIIFSGTIKMNLDPLAVHSDLEIWNALTQVKMSKVVESLPGSLSFVCQSEGLNFSVGQRQLLCLGRTLLHKTAVLILDEATAAVDLETDKVVQETIKRCFSDCTILTIAHRIDTVLSCDRILVLDGGQLADRGKPNAFLDPLESANSISRIQQQMHRNSVEFVKF